jgi:hypothetical protein
MSHKSASFAAVGTIGIDLGKNSFHLVGHASPPCRPRIATPAQIALMMPKGKHGSRCP